MTEPMRDEQFEREVRRFLAWDAEAVGDAPSADEMAIRITSVTRKRGVGLRLAPQLVWVILLGLLVVAVVGAAALVGGSLLSDPLPRSYEAIFLRKGVDDPRELVVVGVDVEGNEREIARLQDAYMGRGPLVGVVSPGGLLAVTRSTDGYFLDWAIVDLVHPETPPIVVAGIEQDFQQLQPTPFYDLASRPGIFWGPDERLAIPWYERCGLDSCAVDYQVAFVDGRTGATTTVDLPDDLRIMPFWAADGSGVFVSGDGLARQILRPDGTVTDTTQGIAQAGYGRQFRADGDIVKAVSGRGVLHLSREGVGVETLLQSSGVEIADVAWTAAGDGLWLTTRASADSRDLLIERFVPPSGRMPAATLRDPVQQGASRLTGDFVSIAPDDSLLVLSIDRLTGTEDDGERDPAATRALIAPGTETVIEVDGAFAGWLETAP